MAFIDFFKKYKSEYILDIGYVIILIIVVFCTGCAIYYVVGATGNIPWHKCIVPYTFNEGFTNEEKETIKKYMNTITEASKTNTSDQGIKFIDKTNEIEFIAFNKNMDNESCGNAKLSKRLGGQSINLSSRCITESVVIHEIMHSLGFIHEHNRSDRDTYIIINYDNILDGYKDQFNIENNVVIDNKI